MSSKSLNARGSGMSVTELNAMLNKFGEMQQMMKKMGKFSKMMGKMGGGLPGMLRR
jgi:signal recognition particle subunit SRP54